MKIRAVITWSALGLLTVALAMIAGAYADDAADSATDKPAIYDESADGAKQVADALALAGKEGKRVLLQFGANWCPWCHKLHALYASDKDIAAELKRDYVVVMIDINKGHNKVIDAQYGHPTLRGLPVVVVLDSDGKLLATADNGELMEGDHHSPVKIMAFLQKWSPKRPRAA